MLRVAPKRLLWQATKTSGWATSVVPTSTTAAVAAIATTGTQGQGTHDAPSFSTDFSRRASHFKKRMRGKSQYAFAREEAQRFLDAEVPKVELSTWMDAGINAIALAQLLQFFEIQPEASVASLLLNKLIRQAEDSAGEVLSRLEALLCLLSIRPEENYERVFQVVVQVLQQLQNSLPVIQDVTTVQGDVSAYKALRRSLDAAWDPFAVCAKVLQRCGKRVPPTTNDELAKVVMAHLQATPPGNLPYLQAALLRIYSWMVRAERPESNQVLYILVEHTGDFSKDKFATLALACVRHNQLVPLPIELVERLTRAAFFHAIAANARETSSILGSLAKLLHSLTPNVNGVTTVDLYHVQDYYSALLEDFSARILRFLNPSDALYCSNAEDISSIVFAYELGGHTRHRRIFEAYGTYVQHCVQTFEPPQLALATGILRRAQLLTPQLAARLSERIEVVLGELRLAELSHICATFAVLPAPKPTWWEEAKAVALRLHVPDASGVVQLNLAIAFPDEPNLVETVDYAQITSKQLMDVLPITLGSARFEEPVVSTLCARLAAEGERFSPDDLQFVLSCGRPTLLQAAQEHLRRAFAEPQWNTDTLFSLPLVCDPHHPERNQQTFSAAKALAAAKAASVGPLQFVSLAELLLATFGDGDAAIRHFVQVGGEDLIKSRYINCTTAVRYLAVVRRYPSVVLSTDWLRGFTEHVDSLPRFAASDLEDLLISLRSLYEDVAKTPALQTLLSLLVEKSYTALTDADEQVARITVLLVYLQSGITLPLLTAQHPLLAKVTNNEANYSPQVRKALAMMPLPKPAPAEERRGRFVLKHLDKTRARDDAPNCVLDLNASDPFEVSIDVDALSAVEPTHAPTQSLQQPAAAPTAAATQITKAPSLDPYRPPPTPPAAQAEPSAADIPATETAAPEEKHMSYYAKFFSSSVGQMLTGRGMQGDPHKEAKDERSHATSEAPQPRRTRLHPSVSATSAPPLPVPSAATTVNAPSSAAAATPSPPSTSASARPPSSSAVPVTTFTTAWGPTTASSSMAGWAFAANPLQSSSFSSAAAPAGAVTTEHQHNTTFTSLFGSAPPTPVSTTPTTPTPIMGPVVHATPRPTGMGGNNVFFDPSSTTAQRSRPVISRKAAITRQGGGAAVQGNGYPSSGGGAGASTEQMEARRAHNEPSRLSESQSVMGNEGGNCGPQIVLNAASMPSSNVRGGWNDSMQNGSHGNNNNNGVNHFMQKTGVTKITGYNMDGEVANTAEEVAAASAPTAPGNRPALDWMEAARRVARVTRHPRSKTKSRTHNSLSAWLNTPSARLDATPEESDENTAAADSAKSAAAVSAKSGARQTTVAAALHRRSTKKDKAAAAAAKAVEKAAAEAAEAETSTHGKRGGGRGKANRTAKTTKATKAAAAATAAAKKKAPAKKAATKLAAANVANGGRAKKTSATSAARPAVKSAKKAVKAAAKKAAPAKKKPTVGKGKKK